MKTDEVLNRAKTGHSECERDTLSPDGLLMPQRKSSSLCACLLCAHIRLTNPSLFKPCALRVPKALGSLDENAGGK